METQSLLLILLAAALVIILALIGALLWIVLSVLSRLLPAEAGKPAFQFFRTVAAEDKLNRLGDSISKRTEELKTAAKELSSEAREESDNLIGRAEKLTTDLKTASAKSRSITEIKPLIHQGAEVMEELEKQTRKLASTDQETQGDG